MIDTLEEMSIQHDWTKEDGNIIILKLSNEEKES